MSAKMKVPFGTITITDSAKRLINEALESKRISSGKYVRQFEESFAGLIGVKEAVAVSSGTDADILALAVLHDFGATRSDEVIVPALSFVATGNAVVHAGFTPVFVDIERNTLNIDPTKIEAAITEKTRAIMPVHLMGKPAAMEEINAIAKTHGLKVIEDAAEAHGAMYKGKPAGLLADLGAFSVYVAHIITTGEGGIVTTDNEEYAEVLRSLRSHGRTCACKQCSLNINSGYCAKRFRGDGGEDIRFTFIPIIVNEDASFTRAQLTRHLEQHGIETRTLFASMPTQCPGFGYLGYELGQFPNAEYIGQHGLHIGVHQDVGIEEMEYVLKVIESFLEQCQN